MSSATIDRCLGPARFKHPSHGLSTTKPGSLLKKAIPVRTFTPWDEDKPGFLEIDLVGIISKIRGDYQPNVQNNCQLWKKTLVSPYFGHI
jgi:hypothetical protein